MILFFHFICLLARYIVSNISKSLSGRKLYWDDEPLDAYSDSQFADYLKERAGHVKYPVYEDDTLKFFPPVYVQRYETVALILEDAVQKYNIKKVADFGCAELGLLGYLKNLGVTEILEVDIDSELLEQHAHKAAPLTSDYLMGRWKHSLDVYVLAGNIADYDDHLIGCDALVAIELIEHLNEEDFERMPYNVFYKIKPKIVIFTTPNAEFNSLFPNFSDFRHEDHKFEWTRKEFYEWTQLVLKIYPEYSVRFYGIGAGPEGTENLGCCTQMAVFIRSDDAEYFLSAREEAEGINSFKLIKHYKYPLYIDSRTIEEKIVHEIQYQSAYLSTLDSFYNYECNESEIPLCVLKEFVSDLCSDDEELLSILGRNGFTLRKKDYSWFVVFSEVESNQSDITSRCEEDWLNEEISESFCENDLFLSERSWDDEPCSENIPHFQSDGNLKQLESIGESNKDSFLDKVGRECIAMSKGKFASAPQSYNELVRVPVSPKLPVNSEFQTGKNKKSHSFKSRIPHLKGERYESSFCENDSLAFMGKPFKKISKSCSLDSCLENINCKQYESQCYYINLTPGGSSSNMDGSLSPRKRKQMKNCSGSSLLSSSLDRAGDSGYPFSFSPPEDNLTPEQVDELFTENEMSRSTSSSSELNGDDVVNHIHPDVFIEDIPVENGDLANNNRDGEGNNVEGLIGQRLVNEVAGRDPNDNLFFLEAEEFPPWLLNLGELALRPLYFPLDDSDHDEGVRDDSSGRFSHSPELEDFDIDF